MKPSTASGISRRHDLDALRAFAMFLGVALHAALPFVTDGWMVRDPQKFEQLGQFTTWVHGFRMPLFMLVSGYFTMMMYRRRGLGPLLKQRFLRVALPLFICVITILPLQEWAATWANERAAAQDAERYGRPGIRSELVDAVFQNDLAKLHSLLSAGVDPNQTDPQFGSPALQWAARLGNEPAAKLLIESGADVNARDRGGNRPLHSSAYFARPGVMAFLLEKGADPKPKRDSGEIPWNLLKTPWNETKTRAGELRVPLADNEQAFFLARAQCRDLLVEHGGEEETKPAGDQAELVGPLDRLTANYRDFLTSDAFLVSGRPRFLREGQDQPLHLFLGGYFDHLWFLWFLCWLVGFFSLFMFVVRRLSLPTVPRWLVLSPLCWLWLIPLTMIPQLFMGIFGPRFGPATCTGLLPEPHILLYYAVFFGFGAIYYDADDTEARLGRWYWLLLPVATFVLLPHGMETMTDRPVYSGFIQVIFAWAMCFGLIGLLNRFLKHENQTIRYLSDSAYWLYIAHHPLVAVLHTWLRPWDLPAVAKWLILLAMLITVLLISYQTLVRYTWIGRLLNGPRVRVVTIHEEKISHG